MACNIHNLFCRIHIICLKKIDSLWQLRTSARTSCAVLSAVQCRCALDVNSCIFQYLHGFCSLVWNIIQIHPTSLINFVSAIRLLFVDMILSSRHSVSFAYIANALHINYEIWILAPFQTVLWYQKKVETYFFQDDAKYQTCAMGDFILSIFVSSQLVSRNSIKSVS